MGLYENVKEAAKAKGYSINRLEKELGFPRSYIIKFQTIMPSADKIQKIADFLGVTPEYLLTGESHEGYYLNQETAEMAQKLFENPDLRVLFDAAADATPEDLKTTTDVLLALKKKERHEDE